MPAARLEIRQLCIEDIPACARLYRRAYELPCYGGGWDEADGERIIRDVARLFPDECFVAAEEGVVQGFILCSSLAGVRATVEEFAVAPEAQGRGVGTALFDHILAFYRQRGLKMIELVANRAAPAYRFYVKRGFGESQEYRLMSRRL